MPLTSGSGVVVKRRRLRFVPEECGAEDRIECAPASLRIAPNTVLACSHSSKKGRKLISQLILTAASGLGLRRRIVSVEFSETRHIE